MRRMKENEDVKLKLTDKEKKILLKYYNRSKKKAKKIKDTENFRSMNENDIDTICTIELFRHLLSMIDKAKNQYEEDFNKEIESKFLEEIFIFLSVQKYEATKNKGIEKDSFINEYFQKLSVWFKFYTLIIKKLNQLYKEFDHKKRIGLFTKKIDEFFNEFEEKFSSIEIREKNFLFSLIRTEVINSINNRNDLDIKKLEIFDSLIDSFLMNRILGV